MAHNPIFRDSRTYEIIGAAMAVHRELGPGFLESVYADAMVVELRARGVPFAREVRLPIVYRGQPLPGHARVDFLCFDEVIVELKAQSTLGKADASQVIHYLKAALLETGLLLNFGEPRLNYERFIFTHAAPVSATSAASVEKAQIAEKVG